MTLLYAEPVLSITRNRSLLLPENQEFHKTRNQAQSENSYDFTFGMRLHDFKVSDNLNIFRLQLFPSAFSSILFTPFYAPILLQYIFMFARQRTLGFFYCKITSSNKLETCFWKIVYCIINSTQSCQVAIGVALCRQEKVIRYHCA